MIRKSAHLNNAGQIRNEYKLSDIIDNVKKRDEATQRLEQREDASMMGRGAMTDKQWIAQIDKVSDPVEVLKLVQDNEDYLGFDPYFRDIRDAILRAVARALAKAEAVSSKEQGNDR